MNFYLFTSRSNVFFALSDLSLTPHISCDGTKKDTNFLPGIIDPNGISCNFDDKNLCKWRSTSDSRNSWSTSDTIDSTQSVLLPKFDHTKQSSSGYYAYSKQVDKIGKSMSLSVDLSSLRPGTYCFSLWTVFKTPSSYSPPLIQFIQNGKNSFVDR
ncbi:hypothetical protein HDE_14318 [Halotydeus destructor]|nr:hypothetical protein HDE_14318 [Halotydeus destructor]